MEVTEYLIERMLSCENCPKTFESNAALRKHRSRLHREERKLSKEENGIPCSDCQIICKSKHALRQHRHKYHKELAKKISEDRERFKCPHCEWKTVAVTEVNRHIQQKHPEIPNILVLFSFFFQCLLCPHGPRL